MRSSSLAAAAALLVGPLLAGCGGGDQREPEQAASRAETGTQGSSGARALAAEAAERAGAAEKAIVSDPSVSEWTFGAAVTLTERTPIAALNAEPAKYAGQRVSIEGTVSRVCQASGCWAEVQAEDGSTILATSLDETVFLPKNCAGQHIVVEGVVPPPAEGGEATASVTLEAVRLTRPGG